MVEIIESHCAFCGRKEKETQGLVWITGIEYVCTDCEKFARSPMEVDSRAEEFEFKDDMKRGRENKLP